MDNLQLTRWRATDAVVVLTHLASHAKRDPTYVPVANAKSTRWHATIKGLDFELVLTGPKFYDPQNKIGGGGAIDLTMYLARLSYRKAVVLLRELQL